MFHQQMEKCKKHDKAQGLSPTPAKAEKESPPSQTKATEPNRQETQEVALRVYKHPNGNALCVDMDKKHEKERNYIKDKYKAKWEDVPAAEAFPAHKAWVLHSVDIKEQAKIYKELKTMMGQAQAPKAPSSAVKAPTSVIDKNGATSTVVVPVKIGGQDTNIELGLPAAKTIAEFLKNNPETKNSLGVK